MTVLAHSGEPLAAHDLWSAWNLDPVLMLGLPVAWWVYRRGSAQLSQTRLGRWRTRCFGTALLAIAVALVSPLEPLSGALASAHMVQHVLLLLVAAPLLAFSAPFGPLMRGTPPAVRRFAVLWHRRLGLSKLHPLRSPATVWLLHVGALWFWHASVPYEAALENEFLHVVEHASFLITAVLFWALVIGKPVGGRVSYGLGILLVFTVAMQSVFLSALLTFAETPWYPAYSETAPVWGLTPLGDQQLAGVIMWIPAGLLYVGVALAVLVAWVRSTETEEVPLPQPRG